MLFGYEYLRLVSEQAYTTLVFYVVFSYIAVQSINSSTASRRRCMISTTVFVIRTPRPMMKVGKLRSPILSPRA